MNAQPQTPSGLQLRLLKGGLQWMLDFKKPIVTIDGGTQALKWGYHLIPLPPGPHTIDIHCPSLFVRSFEAKLQFTVYPGYVTGVDYDTSDALFIFQAGSIRDLGCKPWGT
ncbi:MAG: hypothetical protein H6719_37380 [Sandaracinaceae bacterium]|nr:hypothetical protein [Sandaracinaceae bacterium]